MLISISNTLRETWIVFGALTLALVIFIRRTRYTSFFPVEVTNQLKGVAILLVILSHIGYFLVTDHSFLVPLSNYAGVGVDLFLILSGYGLVASALKRPLSILQFYKKRLTKIYLPVVATLFLLLTLDFVVLHKTYPLSLTIKNLLGFFPQADLYREIDSPLWFITPLIFYYLIFPLLFWRRFPLISSIVVALLGYYITQQNLPGLISVTEGVAKLYQLHFIGFPVGMALGALFNQPPTLLGSIGHSLHRLITKDTIRRGLLGISLVGLYFAATHSEVGKSWRAEEYTSIGTALLLLLCFLFSKVEFKFLSICGALSFEMYLLHWPILYRYGFLYSYLSAGLATALYFGIFILVGFGYQTLVNKLSRLPAKHA